MKRTASNNAAAVTGVAASAIGYFLGPLADRRDASGSVWLLILVLLVGLLAYFFVIKRKRKITTQDRMPGRSGLSTEKGKRP